MKRSVSPSPRIARLVTEIVSPAVLAAVMPLVVGLVTVRPWPIGVGWGALTLLFSAVVPYGIIRLLMRAGAIEGDHHIPDRRQRRVPLLFGLLSVIVGIALLAALGAPATVVAMALVMLAVVVVVGSVNLVWKLSGHTSVAAGSAAVLAVLVGGWSLVVSVPVVAVVVWSRVRLGDHTLAQALAGAFVGAGIAAAIWAAASEALAV